MILPRPIKSPGVKKLLKLKLNKSPESIKSFGKIKIFSGIKRRDTLKTPDDKQNEPSLSGRAREKSVNREIVNL